MKKYISLIELKRLFYEIVYVCKLSPVRTFFTFLLISITSLSTLILPLVLKRIIEKLTLNNMTEVYSSVLMLTILYGVIWIMKDTSEQLREIVFTPSIQQFLKEFVSRMYQSVLDRYQYQVQLNVGHFFDSIIRLRDTFSGLVWGALFYILPIFVELIIGSYIIHVYFGWSTSFLIVMVMIIFIVFTLYNFKKSIQYQERTHEAAAKSNNYLMERLRNILLVLFSNKKNYEFKIYEKYLNDYKIVQIKKIVFFEKVRLGQGLIIGISLIFTTVLFFYKNNSNQYIVSDFVMLNAYLMQFLSPLSYIGHIMQDIREGITNFQDATNYIQPNKFQSSREAIVKGVFERIRLENVTYEIENKKILRNIELNIHRGMKVLIVGSSGSGKSTLLRVISKILLPTKGRIILNNQDITQTNLEEVTSLISYLPQEVSLFNDTIFYNTAYSDLDIKLEVVAHLLNKISFFKESYSDLFDQLNKNVTHLSVGERQKILISRILLENREIIIMDEPFSALDDGSIMKIMDIFASEKRDNTVIIASHKIINPEIFDLIIHIEKGIIQTQGDSSQILVRSSSY